LNKGRILDVAKQTGAQVSPHGIFIIVIDISVIFVFIFATLVDCSIVYKIKNQLNV